MKAIIKWLGRFLVVLLLLACIGLGILTDYTKAPEGSRPFSLITKAAANTPIARDFLQVADVTGWDIMGSYSDDICAGWLYYSHGSFNDPDNIYVSGFYRERAINGFFGKFVVMVQEGDKSYPGLYLLDKNLPLHYWNGLGTSDEQDQLTADLKLNANENYIIEIWPVTSEQFRHLEQMLPNISTLYPLPVPGLEA